MRLAPVIYCYNQLIFITDQPITAFDVRTRKSQRERVGVPGTVKYLLFFWRASNCFCTLNKSLCLEVNSVTFFRSLKK